MLLDFTDWKYERIPNDLLHPQMRQALLLPTFRYSMLIQPFSSHPNTYMYNYCKFLRWFYSTES
jgi:hypothetical protein